MKPSERINEITAELLEETKARVSERNFIRNEYQYRESAFLRAVVRYLDERDEPLVMPESFETETLEVVGTTESGEQVVTARRER